MVNALDYVAMNTAVYLQKPGCISVINMAEAIWFYIQELPFKLEMPAYCDEIWLVSFSHKIIPASISPPPW